MNFAMAAAGTLSLPASTPFSSAAAVQHRKLTDAAQQFEGMMLQEMLKPMKEHGFCAVGEERDGNDKDGGSGFADTLSSFGAEAMATSISKSGGLGIAKRVVEQVEGEKALRDRAVSGARATENSK